MTFTYIIFLFLEQSLDLARIGILSNFINDGAGTKRAILLRLMQLQKLEIVMKSFRLPVKWNIGTNYFQMWIYKNLFINEYFEV